MTDLKAYGLALERLRETQEPINNYIEESERLICELRLKLKQEKEYSESMRPHWAQGYSSDSMAAQASTSALSEVWDLIGVKDQTACMEKLRLLIGDAT